MARTRADLIADRFGVATEVEIDPSTPTLGLAAAIVVPQNPNRLAFTVVNLGSGAVYLKPKADVSTSSAVRLAAAGGAVTLSWEEDFDLVGMEWWGLADLAATPVLTQAVNAR